ncbi:S-layer homology domain-containing protein [Paenalkalicoccus suaedae]|uniref:S-layer homology domain-containing protein n=1 Tax=Paenalkalicoccus suaedae TaxID=2592382 RepID=A0A859FGY8_9BACI|nr:S-layer homology domain-containing protein [Paenalkalicoccus suaedae]QKS72389.1 S-layer homology domain-containing protein [Paenalkalicoccus suaedae]
MGIKNTFRHITCALAITMALTAVTPGAAAIGTKTAEQKQQLSTGVEWTKASYLQNSLQRDVNTMKINLRDTYTDVELAYANPFTQRRSTLQFARDRHTYENRVVAGINGAFFETGGEAVGFPTGFMMENGKLLRYGRNSNDNNGYNFSNQAFGMNQNGTARIGEFTPQVRASIGGKNFTVAGVDNITRIGESITMFTPNHHLPTPGQNASSVATELVIDNVNIDMKNIRFGQTITGTVTSRNTFREPTNPRIPQNGFVLSANGGALAAQLENVKVGDQVSVQMEVEDHWKQAEFVLGSGPFLVKDGRRHITMSPSAPQAVGRLARSAVGISRDGSQVFFVTVDRSNPQVANGMTITELADYLISLGADRAINLDGGGSTTMVGLRNNYGYPTLLNNVTQNTQRIMPTSLQVRDSSPPPQVTQPEVTLTHMTNASEWRTSAVQGTSSITSTLAQNEPRRENRTTTKLTYDFSNATGTAAAYMRRNEPFLLHGSPKEIGMWVHGNGVGNWLRGYVYDGKGTRHTINFTEENGLNWNGWRYVKASLPQGVPKPYTFDEIYLVEPAPTAQDKGSIYFSTIHVLDDSIVAQRFSDVAANHWAFDPIQRLSDRGVIGGFPDGTFRPSGNITRAQAAAMLVRDLGLQTAGRPNPGFIDVTPETQLYANIAAVAETGIMGGFSDGSFAPAGTLTRAELATILVRAYQLSGSGNVPFPDVASTHWAYQNIGIMNANNLVGGYSDGTYRPNIAVTRAEFATFLNRIPR